MEPYILRHHLDSYSRARGSPHRNQPLFPSWAPYRQDPFDLQKASESPPFPVLRCRGSHLPRGHRRYRPSPQSDPGCRRIPAVRSNPNLFPSVALFLEVPYHQSLAWVVSSSSAMNPVPNVSLRRRIISPIAQSRSLAITGHFAFRMKNVDLSTSLRDS